MTTEDNGSEYKFTAGQKQTVLRWLEFKLSQARNASEHYNSLPRKMRTEGDEAALLHWRRVIGIIHWLAPGGRGLYDMGKDIGKQGQD